MVAMLNDPVTYKLPIESAPSPDVESNGAERRVFPRKELFTRVQGLRVDHTVEARRQPQLSLSLRDISAGGLSAVSPFPLASGETLSVFFPASSGKSGWGTSGRVIRCEPSALGYRVALEFETLRAA